jgi:hypothetical protein
MQDHHDSYHSDAPDTVRLISSKNTQLNEGKSAEDESHSEKHHFLPNPSRILDAQQVHCSFFFDQRYIPAVAKVRPTGVVMLKDCRPSESDVTVAINTLSLESLGCAEADLPLPFSWPN